MAYSIPFKYRPLRYKCCTLWGMKQRAPLPKMGAMHRRSIVIIEDDQSIRETLKMFLELEGYEALTAENGKEGLELLRRISKPGLILLDLSMPVMDGWEFMERLEKDPERASIPLVLVTAYADRAHGALGREILRKPVDLDALSAAVQRYCEEPRKDEVGAA